VGVVDSVIEGRPFGIVSRLLAQRVGQFVLFEMKASPVTETDISRPWHEFGEREGKFAARGEVDIDAGDDSRFFSR
jgi:hypothetical protein